MLDGGLMDRFPDSAFVQGIQFLIKEGIIVIEQERLETESQVVESLDLTISSPPKFEKYFGKYVDVFGVPIYATSQVTDGKVLHAANVLAQYLDNDADGTPGQSTCGGETKGNKLSNPIICQ